MHVKMNTKFEKSRCIRPKFHSKHGREHGTANIFSRTSDVHIVDSFIAEEVNSSPLDVDPAYNETTTNFRAFEPQQIQ